MKRVLPFLLTLVPSVVFAHDFFLYPSSFRVKVQDSVQVALHVDEVFPGKFVKWNPKRILRFEHWYATKRADVSHLKPLPDSSGVILNIEKAGLHMLAFDWSARLIELEPELFKRYLESEGLDYILKLRTESGAEHKPGRERYSRYVKTLISTGSGDNIAFTNIVGQTIEIVPLENPHRKKVGDSLRFKLLFRGKPLSSVLVSATYGGFTEKPDTYAHSARTDTAGVVTITLTQAGPWLVRSVYMLPLTNATEADWESWWASLTFEVR